MEEKNQEFENKQMDGVLSDYQVKKTKFYKKWWFWVIIAIIAVALISAGSKPTDLISLPKEEYKAQCQSYTYDEIARNPEKYQKKLAKFTGEVVQVMRNGNELELRVAVTPTEYGMYEDYVYVFYTLSDSSENVLEDDIITMYGELRGIQDYETVLGAKVSIPRIYVKYIELVR